MVCGQRILVEVFNNWPIKKFSFWKIEDICLVLVKILSEVRLNAFDKPSLIKNVHNFNFIVDQLWVSFPKNVQSAHSLTYNLQV